MRKFIIFLTVMCLTLLSSCTGKNGYKVSKTVFLMDTVVTLSADCSEDILNGALSLCENYEKLFSRTKEESDIYKINNSQDFVEVNKETVFLIKKAVEYSVLTEGKFDITICPVSSLYDFNSASLPEPSQIKENLKKVDYKKIEIEGNKVKIGDGMIDLGGIAKGYIADKTVEYFKSKGVKRANVNIGGNVYIYGENEAQIGIRKPFSQDIIASVISDEGTFVTSGIYERYIEKDGKIYHHILDTKTGYGVENSLAGVTVIGESSADADALSTVCMLSGLDKGMEIIENKEHTEAVFILKDGSIKLSSGLYRNNDTIRFIGS